MLRGQLSTRQSVYQLAVPGVPLFLCGSPPLPAPPAPAAFCPCRAAFSGRFRQMHSCNIHLFRLAPFTELSFHMVISDAFIYLLGEESVKPFAGFLVLEC